MRSWRVSETLRGCGVDEVEGRARPLLESRPEGRYKRVSGHDYMDIVKFVYIRPVMAEELADLLGR
jgi:hypothetical protein